jgi:hypothetical protein
MSKYLEATRTRCGYAASPAQWRNGTITGVFDVPPKKRGRMGLCVGSEWDSETGALILCGLTLPRDESDTEPPPPYDLVLE